MNPWKKEKLSNLISIKHGFAFKSEYFSKSGEYILLTPGNFKEEGGFRWLKSGQKYYNGSIPKGYILKKGDILVAMTEQAPGLLGSTIVVDENDKYLHNQRLGLIEFKNLTNIDEQFLYHVFNTPFVRKIVAETSSGTKVKHTSPDKICNISIPLPPKDLQKRIASIINNLEISIETTERLIEAKKQYFEALANKILRASNHWQKNSLKNLFHFIKGQGLSKEKLNDNGKYACILYGELYTTYDEVITVVKSKTTYQEGIPSITDDILIPASTTTTAFDLAVASVVRQDNVLLGGDINILRKKNNNISGSFIAYLLTHIKNTEIARYAQGITIVHLYPKDFQHIEIAFPTIEEQTKIAEILNTAKREIDLLKKLAESYRIQKRGLMQKLLNGDWRVAA